MLDLTTISTTTDMVVKLMIKNKRDKDKLPEYHNTYTHSVEMKEAIEIHAMPGKKPDRLVASRYPNQTDQEFKYAIDNYQQTTLPVFLDAVHTMQRAFSDNNWSIDYRNGDDETSDIQMYLEKQLINTPLKMSYDSFILYR